MRSKVLILCGGRSEEHEISLISAGCILKALDRTRFEPIVVGISKEGGWHLEKEDSFYLGEFRADKIRLNTEAPKVALVPYSSSDGRGWLKAPDAEVAFDVVFPIVHGQFGEDGTLQGLLDIVGTPYVGSGCESSAVCMDKVLTKTICEVNGVPVAEYVWVRNLSELAEKKEAIVRLGLPLFVKPSRQGSSVGVSKVRTAETLEKAVLEALRYDSKCLIERGIRGRELECAVLGSSKDARASLPGEILPDASIGWYSYDAKYILADGAKTVVPAALDRATQLRIQELAIRTFKLLECEGLARIDMFLEEKTGRIYLNEVNTLPGFTPISMYPKMWQATGIEYADLINELITLAFSRRFPPE